MTEISTISPDGTVVQAGSGGSLVTAAGLWSFSTGKATTGNYILLNGKSVGAVAGVELEVANGGKLYSRDTTGQWYEWSGSRWLAWVNPTLESTLSPDGTVVQAGSGGGLVTGDGVWTFQHRESDRRQLHLAEWKIGRKRSSASSSMSPMAGSSIRATRPDNGTSGRVRGGWPGLTRRWSRPCRRTAPWCGRAAAAVW